MKNSLPPPNPHYLKERIYGSITLLATNIAILLHIYDFTIHSALSTIITTILGLWLAGIFAEILAEKVIWNPSHHEKKKIFQNSLGILESAKFSIFAIFLAFFEIISLKWAIFSSIILAVLQIIAIIFFVSMKKVNNLWWNFSLIFVQILVFILIISLKIGH